MIVKQEQIIRHKNDQLLTNRLISKQEASELNLYSAAILYTLAKHFQAKGHKVSLYSRSFGSFIVPKMLQHYGDEPFEKIFIVAGRLDMQMEVVNGFANSIVKTFADGTRVIHGKKLKTKQELEGLCKFVRDPRASRTLRPLKNWLNWIVKALS